MAAVDRHETRRRCLTLLPVGHIIQGDLSEQPSTSDHSPSSTRFPGSAYLSALLIALVLLSLVVLARPRRSPEPVFALPTVVPTLGPATVYVAGQVRHPGTYTLPPDSRVEDAVVRAGGMTARADPLAVNLAQLLRDEMQITVPAKEQAGRNRPSATSTKGAAEPSHGPININTATQAQLEELPGIGPSKAAAILEYRQQHGLFRKPEDLQEVSGIGPKLWARLKDKVTV